MALTFASNGLLSKLPAKLTESPSIASDDYTEPHPFLSNGLLSLRTLASNSASSEPLSAPLFDASPGSPPIRELRPNDVASPRKELTPAAHSIDPLLVDDEMDDGMSNHIQGWGQLVN